MEVRFASRVFHKPTRSGTGRALKLELRIDPAWIELDGGGGYWDREANRIGGLFLELVPQLGIDAGGNPTFAWEDEARLIRVKLGVPDMAGLIASYRAYRLANGDVPLSLQGKPPNPATCQFFHKTAAGSTVISYSFEADGAVLRVSKSKDHYNTIKLTQAEELVLMCYLEMSLDKFLEVGKR